MSDVDKENLAPKSTPKTRCCSQCQQPNHDARNCPLNAGNRRQPKTAVTKSSGPTKKNLAQKKPSWENTLTNVIMGGAEETFVLLVIDLEHTGHGSYSSDLYKMSFPRMMGRFCSILTWTLELINC